MYGLWLIYSEVNLDENLGQFLNPVKEDGWLEAPLTIKNNVGSFLFSRSSFDASVDIIFWVHCPLTLSPYPFLPVSLAFCPHPGDITNRKIVRGNQPCSGSIPKWQSRPSCILAFGQIILSLIRLEAGSGEALFRMSPLHSAVTWWIMIGLPMLTMDQVPQRILILSAGSLVF